MIYAGIDNGKKGGLCAIDAANNIVAATPMPMLPGSGPKKYDWPAVRDWLVRVKPISVAMEKVFTTPVISKRAVQSLADCLGVLKGICLALALPYAIYAPKDWQRWAFRGVTYSDTKAASIMVAQQLQPTHDWQPGKLTTPHDGLTDAYHIARYGKQALYGT